MAVCLLDLLWCRINWFVYLFLWYYSTKALYNNSIRNGGQQAVQFFGKSKQTFKIGHSELDDYRFDFISESWDKKLVGCVRSFISLILVSQGLSLINDVSDMMQRDSKVYLSIKILKTKLCFFLYNKRQIPKLTDNKAKSHM